MKVAALYTLAGAKNSLEHKLGTRGRLLEVNHDEKIRFRVHVYDPPEAEGGRPWWTPIMLKTQGKGK